VPFDLERFQTDMQRVQDQILIRLSDFDLKEGLVMIAIDFMRGKFI
jgi:hypothetical protein